MMNRREIRHWHLLVFFSLFTAVACNRNLAPTELRGQTMGTYYQVKILGADPTQRIALDKDVVDQLEIVNQLMSNWVATSDVSRFNQNVSTTPVEIDDHTVKVVREAIAIAEQTEGAFDPTLGPLIELWGFGTRQNDVVPEAEILAETLDKIGYHKIQLDGNKLSKSQADLTMNLSSLAKGYAVDLVYEMLLEKGFRNFMVNVGGEIRVHGHNAAKKPWQMAIEGPDPNRINTIFRVASLKDVAMATSGDYRNFFRYQGKRYSHLLDPRTGWPIEARITAVSVIAPTCMTADALATALCILSPEDGISLIESMPNIECMLILRDGERLTELTSSGMEAYLNPKG